MIRFQPDSLMQALTRYFDMAAPDANVYIEIAAPDIRFAAIALLALAAALCWRRLGPGRRATFAMLLVLLVSTAIWLRTTGNGRYFMALLVVAGPLAIALVCLLPVTRNLKAALAVLLVAGQAFVLTQQPPWNTWTYLHWKDEGYFGLRLAPADKQVPATYASLSLITYSLIAPQFHPDSRWINLVSGGATPRDQRWTDEFLRDAAARGPVYAYAPSLPWASLPDGRPTQRVLSAFDELLAKRNLRLQGACRFVESDGLLRIARRTNSSELDAPHPPGFWFCPVAYEPRPAERRRVEEPPEAVQRSLAQLARLCPRFFPANEAKILRLPDGWVRQYSNAETRVYVMDNGNVWYKFWRALNPVAIGRVEDLLAGKVQLDCTAIRGSDGAWKSGSQ
jgi:hypothetical protein